MIGGIICPPAEATASTAAAKNGGTLYLIIKGIVKLPVPATLATPLPVNIPIIELATTADWVTKYFENLASILAILITTSNPPKDEANPAKIMNTATKDPDSCNKSPKRPLS